MLLLLDNYDSFVYNLDRYLQQLHQQTLVVRSDAITVESIERLRCSGIVISPGPKTPDHAGCSLEVVRKFSGRVPILGVCLGHQAIGKAMGGLVVKAPRPIHGQPCKVTHSGGRLFKGVPSTFLAGRYHSLVVDRDTLPTILNVTATTDDGLIMAFEHRTDATFGVQFHPESILTEHGYLILNNFLKVCGLSVSNELPLSDLAGASQVINPWN